MNFHEILGLHPRHKGGNWVIYYRLSAAITYLWAFRNPINIEGVNKLSKLHVLSSRQAWQTSRHDPGAQKVKQPVTESGGTQLALSGNRYTLKCTKWSQTCNLNFQKWCSFGIGGPPFSDKPITVAVSFTSHTPKSFLNLYLPRAAWKLVQRESSMCQRMEYKNLMIKWPNAYV